MIVTFASKTEGKRGGGKQNAAAVCAYTLGKVVGFLGIFQTGREDDDVMFRQSTKNTCAKENDHHD